MAYGDYSGPDKPGKGKENGACNRSRCQAEPAIYYNHGSMSWYCADCARDIGEDVVNKRHWPADFERFFPGKVFHGMFQTRLEMQVWDALDALKHKYGSTSGVHCILVNHRLPTDFDIGDFDGWSFKPAPEAFDVAVKMGLIDKLEDGKYSLTELGGATAIEYTKRLEK